VRRNDAIHLIYGIPSFIQLLNLKVHLRKTRDRWGKIIKERTQHNDFSNVISFLNAFRLSGLVKAAGFETLAISHSPDKDKLIRDLGAEEIVRDDKSLAAAGDADVILSTSNSTRSMIDSIQGLRPDGRLVAMGADSEPLSVSLMDLIMKRTRIIGSQQNGPEYLYEALDFVAQGKIKTIVETYPLAEAPKAYELVAEGKARFRPVLTM
jgi:D-arabinose 1-dehydrogenase-like Zn-dependent alcohol dehydrogenase